LPSSIAKSFLKPISPCEFHPLWFSLSYFGNYHISAPRINVLGTLWRALGLSPAIKVNSKVAREHLPQAHFCFCTMYPSAMLYKVFFVEAVLLCVLRCPRAIGEILCSIPRELSTIRARSELTMCCMRASAWSLVFLSLLNSCSRIGLRSILCSRNFSDGFKRNLISTGPLF